VLQGWTRIERAALADGARARVEVLWLNAAAASAMPQPDLLKVVA
jgi:DNA adenine methylase